MSMSNASETALLELLFKNTAWANVGNAAGLQPSGAAGNLYVALHTADPGEAGSQSTNEVSYTGYARVAIAHDGEINGDSIMTNMILGGSVIDG